jgi:hypothetical protein
VTPRQPSLPGLIELDQPAREVLVHLHRQRRRHHASGRFPLLPTRHGASIGVLPCRVEHLGRRSMAIVKRRSPFRVRVPPARRAFCLAADERSGCSRSERVLARIAYTTPARIEASLCQEAFWGASKQRRGRGRSVVVGSGSDLLRSAGVRVQADHAGFRVVPDCPPGPAGQRSLGSTWSWRQTASRMRRFSAP